MLDSDSSGTRECLFASHISEFVLHIIKKRETASRAFQTTETPELAEPPQPSGSFPRVKASNRNFFYNADQIAWKFRVIAENTLPVHARERAVLDAVDVSLKCSVRYVLDILDDRAHYPVRLDPETTGEAPGASISV